jgi:phosphatidylinositol alpha 1,6-mannosyltransferase
VKVAIITETFLPQINGIVRTLEKLIEFLEANGHQALLITMGEGESKYLNTEVLRVDAISFYLYPELNIVKPQDAWFEALLRNKITQVFAASAQTAFPSRHPIIEAKLNEFQPEIIHLVTPVTLGSVGTYHALKNQIPLIASYHTDIAAYAPNYKIPFLENFINFTTKIAYSPAKKTLAPSPSSKKYLESIGLKNVGIFGRGVDHNQFHPNRRNRAVLKDLGLDPEKLTLVYAGRLAEEKSIPEIVEAFKNSLESHQIQLLFIGDGPLKNSLKKDLKNYPVAFPGFKKGLEYAELQANGDIFIFPSKTETFGQVVLEAMASGVAVLAYNASGIRDLVIHNESGFLAENHLEFKSYLNRLIEDAGLRSRFASKSLEEAQKRSWYEIMSALIKDYEECLQEA